MSTIRKRSINYAEEDENDAMRRTVIGVHGVSVGNGFDPCPVYVCRQRRQQLEETKQNDEIFLSIKIPSITIAKERLKVNKCKIKLNKGNRKYKYNIRLKQ